MKSRLVLLLRVFLLLCTAAGCGTPKEQAPLRICFDIGSASDQAEGSSRMEQSAKGFLEDYDIFTKDLDWMKSEEFEVEVIPSDSEASTERAAALQRIRTEMMTGGGPDVFVISCQGSYMGGKESSDRLESSRLFPYPEKAIDSDLFLPLDDYIKDAEMTDWDNQQPQVMAEGRDKEGRQVLVPMSFTLPLNVFRQKDLPGGAPVGGAWDQVMAGEEPLLAPQAHWCWYTFDFDYPDMGFHPSGFSYVFSALADFEAGRLSFTEEQLLAVVSEDIQACKRREKEKNAPDNYAVFADPGQLIWSSGVAGLSELIEKEDEPLVMVPLANREGGVTARVSRYCAVNRNTERPLDAFRVVDCLMSPAFQANSGVERAGENTGRMPMDMSLLARGTPVEMFLYMPQQHLEEWRRACGTITSVRFPSPLDSELEDMMDEIQQIMADSYEPDVEKYPGVRLSEFLKGEISDEQLKEIVHRHYRRMCRLVDES